MPVNRFDRPVNQRVISQFVPKDMNMIARVLASKQGRYDQQEAQFEALQDENSALSGVGQSDLTILRESGQKLDKLSQDFSNKDLSDPRIAKDLRAQAKLIANDPLIRNTQSTLASVTKYKEDVQKMKLDGTYRPENDPFQEQLAQYEAQGGAKSGPLSYTGIVKGVDERKTAETFFDNIPETGRFNWAQVGDSIKKVGWEGITEGQISGAIKGSIGAFAETTAGQQALRRYRMLERGGQLTDQATPEKYIAGILASAGAERIGTKSTGGGGGSGFGSGGSGFTGGRETETNVGFTGDMSKKIETAKFEEGKLIGSGNVSFTDVIFGDKSFNEWWNDESLTEEERKTYLPIAKLAEAKGITKEQAAEMINKKANPTFVPAVGKLGNDLSKYLEDKGAGAFSTMIVHDQNGEKVDGAAYLKDLGIINDDFEYDKDIAAKHNIRVLGEHDPKSGYIRKGLHVSIGGNNVIFEQPTQFNQEDPRTQAWVNGELSRHGIVEVTPGSYIFVNKDGSLGSFTTDK